MPYDRLVYELVSAKGVSKPGEEGFNGFVNFLAGNLEENAVQATAKTSQIFLGLQVQCTQCHNHPFNDWKQNQFWEMNAFFRQTRALRRFETGAATSTSVELVNQDFAGENNKPERSRAVLRAAQRAVEGRLSRCSSTAPGSRATAAIVQRRRSPHRAGQADRRLRVPAARRIVNRMWAHFLGYGFTKPIDDMGPHNPPTHPELLDGWPRSSRATATTSSN